MKLNRIIQGDCLEVMKELLDNSVDLVITSPPYDNLRDYNGYTFNFNGIAKELFRIVKQGGVVVWVVGDATVKGSETGTSFKQALYFKEIGFNLHDTMIYRKENYVPLTHNGYEQEWEYMFIFSKGKPNTFNPIKIQTKWGGTETWGKPSFYKTSDGNLTEKPRKKIGMYKIKGNIFAYQTGSKEGDKIAKKHPARFPEKLAEDHILSWSNEGDLILDPMCGSGTTCKMARLLNRDFVGIEISEKYCKIARERLRQQILL